MKFFWNLVKEAFAGWMEHKCSRLAAALAYYAIFSVAPILVIVVIVAGLVFGKKAAEGELVQQISNLVSKEGASVIEGMVKGAGHLSAGVFASIAGAIALLIGSTGLFSALQDALYTIFEVPDEGGWMDIIKSRFFSFVMVVGIGVLLLALLLAGAVLSVLTKLMHYFPGVLSVLNMFNFLLSFAVITFLFAVLYKVFSGVRLKWGDVWVGAALTSLLFSIGKFLLGIYLESGRMRSAYGAAGSVIVLLFWFYFSAQVFLFGAEFARAFEHSRGQRQIRSRLPHE
jgi:membrane protein